MLLGTAVLLCCGDALPDQDSPASDHERTNTMQADRIPPPEVKPVTIGDVRYEVIHWGKDRFGQNGGYIGAFDARSDDELWTLQIYEIEYDPEMEGDVQDIFISSMSKTIFGGKLKLTDEEGRKWVVDPEKRTVVAD